MEGRAHGMALWLRLDRGVASQGGMKAIGDDERASSPAAQLLNAHRLASVLRRQPKIEDNGDGVQRKQ